MDDTKRQITKIAREVGKFTVQTMKEEGIGTAEFDVIHLVRHNPGITQTKVRESLKMDKGAAAKRVARLISGSKTESGRWKEPAALCDRKSGTPEKFQDIDRNRIL